jgi:hypothetical protein
MTWRNVDNEMRKASFGDRLQMRTDGLNVKTVDELSGRLKDGPSLLHEGFKAAPGPLRLHSSEFGRVHKGSRVDRVVPR